MRICEELLLQLGVPAPGDSTFEDHSFPTNKVIPTSVGLKPQSSDKSIKLFPLLALNILQNCFLVCDVYFRLIVKSELLCQNLKFICRTSQS